MRKIGLVLCVLGVLAVGAVPALAKIATNGVRLNGVHLNGGASTETGLSLSDARAVRGRLVR
jgi:hypothetical protein